MIPLHLRLAGFVSYRDPIELDFTAFDLACISGSNGAGKSSLLDAITWALFGEARGRSSDVINLHPDVKAAEVQLTFSHEENTYRVQRSLPRNRTTVLEFQVRNSNGWDMKITISILQPLALEVGASLGVFDIPLIPCSGTFRVTNIQDQIIELRAERLQGNCGEAESDTLEVLPDGTLLYVSKGKGWETRGVLEHLD